MPPMGILNPVLHSGHGTLSPSCLLLDLQYSLRHSRQNEWIQGNMLSCLSCWHIGHCS